jgi:hypothetical protein
MALNAHKRIPADKRQKPPTVALNPDDLEQLVSLV